MPADYREARRAPVILSAGVVGIAANTTTYFGYTANANWNRSQVVIPYNMVLRTLRAQSAAAPGVGETFTYTLMVNNIASALTCQTAGAVNTSQDLVNQVAVAAGDVINIRLVTSLNAAVTYHRASMESR